VHRPLPARAALCDLSFAGDWSPMREQLVGMLAAQGVDLRVFGPWRRKARRRFRRCARGSSTGFFFAAAAWRESSPPARRRSTSTPGAGASIRVEPARGSKPPPAACRSSSTKRELDELFDATERAAMLVYRSDEELSSLGKSIPAAARNCAKRRWRLPLRSGKALLRARVAELLRVVAAG